MVVNELHKYVYMFRHIYIYSTYFQHRINSQLNHAFEQLAMGEALKIANHALKIKQSHYRVPKKVLLYAIRDTQ